MMLQFSYSNKNYIIYKSPGGAPASWNGFCVLLMFSSIITCLLATPLQHVRTTTGVLKYDSLPKQSKIRISEILDHRITISYNRPTIDEIFTDLCNKTKLRVIYSHVIGTSCCASAPRRRWKIHDLWEHLTQ